MQIKWLFDHHQANDGGHVFIISVDMVDTVQSTSLAKSPVPSGIRTSSISQALHMRLQSQCTQAKWYGARAVSGRNKRSFNFQSAL
jgi:hypothetical protein